MSAPTKDPNAPRMGFTREAFDSLSDYDRKFGEAADLWLVEHPEEAKAAEKDCRAMLRIPSDAPLEALSRERRDSLTRELRLWVARTNQWPDRRTYAEKAMSKLGIVTTYREGGE